MIDDWSTYSFGWWGLEFDWVSVFLEQDGLENMTKQSNILQKKLKAWNWDLWAHGTGVKWGPQISTQMSWVVGSSG